MSADNYYLIRKDHNRGKAAFVPVMGFASDEDEPKVDDNRYEGPSFPTVEEALHWALREYTEYGVSVHPECGRGWA